MVDTFCSAGGLTLGVGEAASDLGYGSRILAAVDIDARALEVYKANLAPLSTIVGSVGDMVRHKMVHGGLGWRLDDEPQILPPMLDHVGRVDLLIGGPPCQGNSNLNNRTRRRDPRNSLYVTAVALAIGLRARGLILENVPEIRRSFHGVVETAREALESAGYEVDDAVLNAADLGWAQSRRRHFLVASMKGVVPLATLVREFKAEPMGSAAFLARLPDRGGKLSALPEYSPETIHRLNYFQDHPGEYDLPLRLRPDCHVDGTTYMSVYGRMRPDEPVPTLTTGFLTPGRGRFVHPTEARTLTPSEAAYVQGFPTWFNFDQPDIRTQDLTKWIGDAVPLPLGYVASLAVLRPMLLRLR